MVDRSCVVAIEEERGRARVTQVKKNCGIGADPPVFGPHLHGPPGTVRGCR